MIWKLILAINLLIHHQVVNIVTIQDILKESVYLKF